MSEAVWDAQIDHNLKSVFLGCKHVLPIMAAQGAGAIVNIASTSGMRWTGAAQVAYAATKAGVIQLGKVVAVQYAKQGIRVNTVVPGQLHTPMVETRLARLIGVEDRTFVEVEGHARVYAIADEDMDRENEEKTSAVHFVRFELTPAMCAAVKAGASVKVGCDHTNYPAHMSVPPEALASLASDLR
jgi:NAD(P)-dependent dehydrogenase (short-subunit alcohol dehydrogenase family)